MKKTLLLFAFFLVSMVSFAQEDITQQAKDYRTAMMSFLKSEGFSPSITEKGNLMFEREGIAYWITFTDEDPVYIEFHREGLDGEGVNLGALHLAVNDLNYNRRCVKAVIDDDGDVALTVEFYSVSATEFKGTFYRNIKALSSARDYVLEKYAEYEESLESLDNE